MKDSDNTRIYTDVVMELLSSYVLANEGDNSYLSEFLMKTIHQDEEIAGPGFMPGMIFSSIIHLTLLLTIVCSITNESMMDVLSKYGLHYNKVRPMLANMPQLNPEFVNKIAKMFEEN